MYCLDTNAVIFAINRRRPAVSARIEQELTARSSLWLSSIALHELEYGIAKSNRPDQSSALLARFLDAGIKVLPFEREDAREAGLLRGRLERAGTPIGHYDLLIAAHARRHGATLVTSNVGEFSRVSGLAIEDWS